jgi:hypothetical protein
MLDPGSAADWVQASFMTSVVACLAAAGMWALTREQHERSVALSPNTRALTITSRQ